LPAASVTNACPLFAVIYALRYGTLRIQRVEQARSLPHTAMLALIVPLVLLAVAIRRHDGVFAAILLLLLFATRI